MADTVEDTPVLFLQCKDVYEMMVNQQSNIMFEGNHVYKGFLTADVQEHLTLTLAQYSRIIKTLVDMGCIVQLKRGAGRAPSEWVLVGPPELESFKYVRSKTVKRERNVGYKTDQRLRDLSARVFALETAVETLIRIHKDEVTDGTDNGITQPGTDRIGSGEESDNESQ